MMLARDDSTAVAPATAARRDGDTRADETLFISDLHLAAERPGTTALFVDFVTRRAAGTRGLYILGDLFDAWIGDDDDPLPEVTEALRGLAAGGTDCALMHGNRDFLLGRRFARAAGCRLIRDPHRIMLGGAPVLLMHGDLLCTDDVPYQRFRRRVRNPVVQWLFLMRPLAKRRRVAADYRRKSAEAMAQKRMEIMDVNQAEVERRLRRAGVTRLVHGHTHRPGDHRLVLDGLPAMRHVLADWHEDRGEVLIHREGLWSREPITPG